MMSDVTQDLPDWRGGWLNRLVARPAFQSWASRFPLTRGQARRDGAVLFDVVQGFVQSQVLMALVELDLLRGHFSNLQLVVTLLVMTLLVPCVNSIIVLFKERRVTTALAILGTVIVYALTVGGLINHACRAAGITFGGGPT